MLFKDIKNWDVQIEKEITDGWAKSENYSFNKSDGSKIYSIDTPPPYINSPIHIGHAISYCFMDFFARYKRMKGYQVLFPLGLDRNGLPIESGVEKKYKISPFNVPRAEFLNYCKKMLDETSIESIDSFKRLGISFTSYKEGDEIGSIYKTDSEEYRILTQSTFINLFKRGLIYEDNRVSNWDTKLRTTISDSEIEYKEISSSFSDIIWKVKETGEQILIGTTRPELICSCGMVIYNPRDKRYKHLEGKTAITPLFGIEVPIKAHPLASIDKGTGLVMMCSAGDLSDIQFFREMNLKPIISIDQEGKMNSNAGEFKGLDVKEARSAILKKLDEMHLLSKTKKIAHSVPISERSKAEIEFIEVPEFYLKQLEFKKDIKKIAKEVKFYPSDSKKILDEWIEKISIDWPISRRRFYATDIPLWYCKEKDLFAVPIPGRYYTPWKEKVPIDAQVLKNGKVIGIVKDFSNLKWEGEKRVLDTWFDSSISELFIIKYLSDSEFFKRAYPVSLRPQGKEIVRTWLYYTLFRGYMETKQPCFEDIWIHQHILDSKGKKMSKSLGNVIDPQDILKKYGAEALRFWSAIEGDLSRTDFICSEEAIGAEKKTLNKILNLSKFVMLFDKPVKKPVLTDLDQLFVDYMEDLTFRADKLYSKYNFNSPAQELRKFLWDIFASNYLEIVKARAYNDRKIFSDAESSSAKYTLHWLLERFLILVYPIIPQITSLIASDKGIDLLTIKFPKVKKGKSNLKLIEEIMNFNSGVWKEKQNKGISLRAEIKNIKVPKELVNFKKDLIACHNIIY